MTKVEVERVFDLDAKLIRTLDEQRALCEDHHTFLALKRAPITPDSVMWFGMQRGKRVSEVPAEKVLTCCSLAKHFGMTFHLLRNTFWCN